MSPRSTRRAHEARHRRRGAVVVLRSASRPRAPSSAIRSKRDEVAIRIGNALFANRCALCHGPDAKGSLGPDLTQRWARGETDESAFLIVRNGVPGSSMPPNSAPDNELWAIVAYLRSISVMPPLVTQRRREPRPRRVRGRVLELSPGQRQRRRARAGSHEHRRRALARGIDGRGARSERHRRARLSRRRRSRRGAASASKASSRARMRFRSRSSPSTASCARFASASSPSSRAARSR